MSEMVERVARVIDPPAFERGVGSGHGPGECEDCDYHRDEARRVARAAIKAIPDIAFAEFRILSADGELWAETSGPPSVALKEAMGYAAQEPGSVIERVVCIPVASLQGDEP